MEQVSRTNQVKDFYNQVGWQRIGDELYQNAIYEDLRPVSREYIERCHARVKAHLAREGKYLLDAGSGPVQWPAYLTYSEGYKYRVCMDISHVALNEARTRLRLERALRGRRYLQTAIQGGSFWGNGFHAHPPPPLE